MATYVVAVLILFFVEHFGCLLKSIYDLKALRASRFALAAAYAVRCTSSFRSNRFIGRFGLVHLSVSKLLIHGGKDAGDVYSHRTSACAVMAGGARNRRGVSDDALGFADDLLLFFI